MIKKTYDFVFVYEVKNRELENICLLRYELEKRGYRVCFVETWDGFFRAKKPIKAKVAVVYALYSEKTLNFIMSYVENCKKFVNLQWEQVFTNGDLNSEINEESSVGVVGIAKECFHISWGQNNYKKLVNRYQVPDKNVYIGGNVSLDFLREDMKRYYLSQNAIKKMYGIEECKKIYLFISSFSYVNLPTNTIDSDLFQNQGFNVNEFVDISNKSQKIILEWITKAIAENEDVFVVYRPHPAENNNESLLQLEKECDNFKVISDMSIKQWILIADKIYSWWSTSLSEVFAAGKGCTVLRPIQIPYNSELEICNEAKFVETFEEFNSTFLLDNNFPISKEIMEEYYYFDKEIPAYQKIVDFLECVYNNSREIYVCNTKKNGIQRIRYNVIMKIKLLIFSCEIIYKFAKKVLNNRYKGRNLDECREEFLYNRLMAKKNHMDRREIKTIMKKIYRVKELS